MTKKVCITTLEFPPEVGGVGESVSRIAHMLIDLGYEVHVAVFRAIFRAERAMAQNGEFRATGCQTTFDPSGDQGSLHIHRLQPAVRSVEAKSQDYLCDLYHQLKQLHRTYQFDILHAFFINEMGFLTTLLAEEYSLPVINSVRGADLNKHIFSPAQFSQVVWTLAHSTWSTFVSKDLMRRARALVPTITPCSSSFWNSITPFAFTHLPEPDLLDRLQGTVIGAVGSFRDKKGLEYLLEACQSLEIADGVTLLLVGDFAEKVRDYWALLLGQSDFADNVVITGTLSRQEAIAYLPYIDIFAIPSLRDGCPTALLEAMLAARAIVGSSVDAIGEILEDGSDGLTVAPGDSADLAAALNYLIEQPDVRQQLGIAARQKALTQMAPAVEQQNWSVVYRLALEKKKSLSQPLPVQSA